MLRHLLKEIDPRPVALARIIIGTAALIRAIVAWRVLHRLTEEDVVRVPYADWLPEPSLPLVIAIIAVWVASAALFTIGWRVPLTGPLLLASIVVTLGLDQQTYSNHLYLMAWLVLLLTLASAGSGINIHRTNRPIVVWPVLLIMGQLSIVYGFSALTKLNESFLSGRVLAGNLGQGLVPFPEGLRTPMFLSVVAALAVFVELFIAVFIWRAGLRPAAFVLGLGLHTSITLLMAGTLELLVFSLEMLALYPLFLSRERLVMVYDDSCASCRSQIRGFKRLDVLRLLDPADTKGSRGELASEGSVRGISVVQDRETVVGFRAVTLTLERLVPTLWLAPVLRLPGLRRVADRWYERRLRNHMCSLGEKTDIQATP